MTRKCVLCKETNYKNNCSFFSAPKDPKIRKKWQEAIGIENYAVTDDTYVCSKHFHKDDIITHWVSGIPPHVITIKYKKCRLRPGAVPDKDYNNDLDKDSDKDYSVLYAEKTIVYPNAKKDQISLKEEKENFLIPREDIAVDSDTGSTEDVPLDNIESCDEVNLDEDPLKLDTYESKTNNPDSQEKKRKRNTHDDSIPEDQIERYNKISKSDNKTITFVKKSRSMERDNTSIDSQNRKNIKNEVFDTISQDAYIIDENELLFEDFLEVCSEIVLPRGWSCLVTSKGHTTTVVYVYMEMTRKGLPFVEKQVYLRNDMMLHYSVADKEINPLNHNLVKEEKQLKVQNLMDIEELIDEFNQRTICEGIASSDDVEEINAPKVAYKDGIKWRHILCPLIINNDSTRCSRCTILAQTLERKSKESFSVPYTSIIFLRKRLKAHKMHHAKNIRKRDRRYEFMRVCKK